MNNDGEELFTVVSVDMMFVKLQRKGPLTKNQDYRTYIVFLYSSQEDIIRLVRNC